VGWYLAPCLDNLFDEINAEWPGRDTTSDGSIGDDEHAQGSSDHNPNSRGSVDAIDVDEDGVDMNEIIACFMRHPSAHYVIYERRIADRDNGWKWQSYSGSNPHDKHAHFSIRQSATAEQDQTPWGIGDMDQATFIKYTKAALDDQGARDRFERNTVTYPLDDNPAYNVLSLFAMMRETVPALETKANEQADEIASLHAKLDQVLELLGPAQ
jgi:hypothetical protein